MTKPIILLDVDGVINAVVGQRGKGDPSVWQDWQYASVLATGHAWPICYSPTVIDYLNQINRSGRAEIRWLTTWGAWAQGDLADQLHIDHFEVAGERDDFVSTSDGWWKRTVVEAVSLTTDASLLWIDDDLKFYTSAHNWARDSDIAMISPSTGTGLTPKHLRAIDLFLEEVEES